MGLWNESMRSCGRGSARKSANFRKKKTVKLLITLRSDVTVGMQLIYYLYIKLTDCSQFLDFHIPFFSFSSS